MIFGATGDLAHRKLLPALYNLAHEGQLPERFEMIGVGRRDQQHEDFRDTATDSIERYSRRAPDPACSEGLLDDMRYVQGSFDDDEVYARARRGRCRSSTSRRAASLDRVFYLSTAPEFFPLIAGKLGAAGLDKAERRERPDRDREAVRLRPRLGPQAQRRSCSRSSTSRRSSGSTTTWARRPSRT